MAEKTNIDNIRQKGKYRVTNPKGLPFGVYDLVVIRYVDAAKNKHIVQGLRNSKGARWVRSITDGVWGAFAHTAPPDPVD